MARTLRNIAIIAHVDHGKTTLVDALLRQGHVFAEHEAVGELIMDSMDQERERGITIAAKNCALTWNAPDGETYHINIVDTPGHADFGGEVERALRMVDGVLLLVDAKEGPMPQTKFVLRKALELGHRVVVVINKVDKPGADIDAALNKTFDLFVELKASEQQLDFPVVYTSGLKGQATLDRECASRGELSENMTPLFSTIVSHINAPAGESILPFQMLVLNLGYDNFKGQLVYGKIAQGTVTPGMSVVRLTIDGQIIKGKVNEILAYQGLKRVSIPKAEAGDIVGIAGLSDVLIGETIADPTYPNALPPVIVDQPTLQMTFGVNTSPFAGREGKFTTSRVIKERLEKELRTNISLRVEPTEQSDQFLVSGRGELHLSVLVESMRREGFELQLGKPQVIIREIEGQKCEPYEHLFIDVPTEFSGAIMEMVGKRRGVATVMETSPSGKEQHLEFRIPTSGLIGLRSKLITRTKGTIIMHSLFAGYEPISFNGTDSDSHGSLISMEAGEAAAYALENIQERGILFIKPGDPIYIGQVIGENAKDEDLEVNPCKGKKLTNMRSSGADEALQLIPPRIMTLENAIDYIGNDELVEVTPQSIRIRKAILDSNERKRQRK